MPATITERDEAAWVTEDRYRYMRVLEVAGRIVRIRITRGADPVPSHARAEVLAHNKTWTHLATIPPDNWIATTTPPSPTVDAAKELGALAERLIHRAAEILAPPPPTTDLPPSDVLDILHALFATTHSYTGETEITPDLVEWAKAYGHPFLIIRHNNGTITLTKAHTKQCAFVTTAGSTECDCDYLD